MLKVRLVLRGRGLGAVRVGTVDDYQGQEARVTLVSTVVSTAEGRRPYASGGRGVSGFVRDPKRFNVAMTRGKALTVVVGNPLALERDPCWGGGACLLHFQ